MSAIPVRPATAPVEKFEFTEHVEKLPFALEGLLRRHAARHPAGSSRGSRVDRYRRAAAIFVGGCLMFGR
jgi:hypothetical protein